MDKQFEMLEATRKNVLAILEACTIDQLFVIPKPYKNHILWNAAHLLATQQMLWYGFTNTPYRLDKFIIDEYARGTTPSGEVDPDRVRLVKTHLLASVAQGREDYYNKIFGPYQNYQKVTTSYGITLNSLQDAISYTNMHESMHFGQIKMLQQLVSFSE